MYSTYQSGEDYIPEKEDDDGTLTIEDISRYPSQAFVSFEDFIESIQDSYTTSETKTEEKK